MVRFLFLLAFKLKICVNLKSLTFNSESMKYASHIENKIKLNGLKMSW